MGKRLFCLAIFLGAFTYLHSHPSWGIVIDQQQNIYFADLHHNERGSVWKLDSKGNLILLLRDFHAHNVNLDKEGRLITAHGEGNHTMIRMDTSGHIDTLVHTSNINDFFGGNATYSKDGNIYFSIDKYLWQISSNGEKERVNKQKLEWNQTIYIDEDGILYAPDIGQGFGSLYKILPDGKTLLLADSLITQLDRPRDKHNDVLLGIAKDSIDNVYIAELAGKKIIKINPEGQKENFYHSSDAWFPTAITFFQNQAYILEYLHTPNGVNGPQIVRFSAEGEKEVLFNYDEYQQALQNPSKPRQKQSGRWWWLLLVLLLPFLIPRS